MGAADGLQAGFRAEFTVFVKLGFDFACSRSRRRDHDDDGADEDAEEAEAFGTEKEVVDLEEDWKDSNQRSRRP